LKVQVRGTAREGKRWSWNPAPVLLARPWLQRGVHALSSRDVMDDGSLGGAASQSSCGWKARLCSSESRLPPSLDQ
jgi:hypothetical protein